MSDQFKFLKAPIVEAVLDIDCDFPPGFALAAIEGPACDRLRDTYPKLRTQLMQEHRIETKPDEPPKMSVRHQIQSLQFHKEDGKQLVQVRAQGFSFNRLAPYTGLDDYLPEIERTWRLFVSIAAPVKILNVRLRYINRILLPIVGGKVNLDSYLRVGPQLPDQNRLIFTGFLNQHTAFEKATGNEVVIVLTTQPNEIDELPLILDIAVKANGPAEVENWAWLTNTIQALRALKNSVFQNTLTEQCLNLFRQP